MRASTDQYRATLGRVPSCCKTETGVATTLETIGREAGRCSLPTFLGRSSGVYFTTDCDDLPESGRADGDLLWESKEKGYYG